MPDSVTGLFTRRMRVVGWLCALGAALLIYDLVTFLPYLPPDCWYPEQRPPYNATDMHFRLLHVISVDFGLAWIGQWGYLGALVWIPVAIVRGVRGRGRGLRARSGECLLFVLVCTLVVATSALVHLTLRRSPKWMPPCLPEIATAVVVRLREDSTTVSDQ
jgi:hypothetical protein